MSGPTRRAALAMGAALAAPRLARAQQSTQLAIATGTTGGVYYPLGGGLANILSRSIPGLSATVEVTGGSVANNQLLGAGRVGMIFSQVDACVDAVRGVERFRGRPVNVRALAVIYTNRMQAVTTAAAGINSMADMKGKRVSTGAPGSATEVMAFRLIEGAGLDRDKDFRARERLSPAESTNAIKDGKLDAYFFVSGIPTSAITDLVLLCHLPSGTPYVGYGKGKGRGQAAPGRRGAVGRLPGRDRGGAGPCQPVCGGAGLLHRAAAAGRAQEHRADGRPDRAGPGAGGPPVAASRGGQGRMGRCGPAASGARPCAACHRAARPGAVLDRG